MIGDVVATINLRIDDADRDALERKARERELTLSEYMRVLIRDAIVDVREGATPTEAGDEPAPETLTFIERKSLSMLHRILAQVLPADARGPEGSPDDQRRMAEIVERGYTAEYWVESAGFSTELSPHDCRRVNDVLEMFRIAQYSLSKVEAEGRGAPDEIRRSLTFRGFDHNRSIELHMSLYVQHMLDDGRWEEVRPLFDRTGGNSHLPMLETYERMLAEYRRAISRRRNRRSGDYGLTLEELNAIAAASVHPSNRRDG
ncbi:YfbU family protein [Microcella daejeonensis]|uniref:YfbU family protein n=1 Tax=Microcella daejeonensis TaxID=2994971 RepID=A0A9E8MMP0_9MICO|nr:YfbU family protein [Microcella daejeonensis]WAB82465.1 YfbU family protein [Microcella daejeonensis]